MDSKDTDLKISFRRVAGGVAIALAGMMAAFYLDQKDRNKVSELADTVAETGEIISDINNIRQEITPRLVEIAYNNMRANPDYFQRYLNDPYLAKLKNAYDSAATGADKEKVFKDHLLSRLNELFFIKNQVLPVHLKSTQQENPEHWLYSLGSVSDLRLAYAERGKAEYTGYYAEICMENGYELTEEEQKAYNSYIEDKRVIEGLWSWACRRHLSWMFGIDPDDIQLQMDEYARKQIIEALKAAGKNPIEYPDPAKTQAAPRRHHVDDLGMVHI